MTVRWPLPAFRGNEYCEASGLSIDSGSFNFSTSSPIVPPGDFPCVVISVSIHGLTVSAPDFVADGAFSFRAWLDAETRWEIEVANTGSPDVDVDADWDAADDVWDLTLPGPAGLWLMSLAGGTGSNAFNPYTDQCAPMAFIPIRTAATYRVTATMRIPDGSGSYHTATHRETFTATDFSGTINYFDADSGSDSNDGLTEGAPKQTGWGPWVRGASNRAALLKVGTTAPHEVSAAITFEGRSNCCIGVWGASEDGDQAWVRPNGTFFPAFFYFNHNAASTTENITVNNLDIDLNATMNTAIQITKSHASAILRSVGYHGCTLRNNTAGTGRMVLASGTSMDEFRGASFFRTDWDQMDAAAAQGMFLSSTDCLVVAWCTFRGLGDDAIFDHHMYLSGCTDQLIIGCHSGETGTGDQRRSFFLNGDGGGSATAARWVNTLNFIDGIDGVARGFDCSIGSNDRDNGTIDDVLTECNFARNLTDNLSWGYNSGHFAVRNNAVVEAGIASVNVDGANTTADTGHFPRIHNNRMYRTGTGWIITFSDGQQSACSVQGNKGWWTSSGSVLVAQLNGSYVGTYGYSWDTNEYYAPNAGTNIYRNLVFEGSDSSVDFTTWQGYGVDANGARRTTAFRWADPANGDFSEEETFQAFRDAGSFTFVAPITGLMSVQATGGSGSGGSKAGGVSTAEGAGGGGGGEFAFGQVAVTLDGEYATVNGAAGAQVVGSNDGNDGGDSYFTGDAAAEVRAKGGGGGGTDGTGGVGGTGGTGDTLHAGGSGGEGNIAGGGGGAAGSPSGPGQDGYPGNHATYPRRGGTGVDGAGSGGDGANSSSGFAGTDPGGGGGGGRGTTSSAGSGAAGRQGQIILSWTETEPEPDTELMEATDSGGNPFTPVGYSGATVHLGDVTVGIPATRQLRWFNRGSAAINYAEDSQIVTGDAELDATWLTLPSVEIEPGASDLLHRVTLTQTDVIGDGYSFTHTVTYDGDDTPFVITCTYNVVAAPEPEPEGSSGRPFVTLEVMQVLGLL